MDYFDNITKMREFEFALLWLAVSEQDKTVYAIARIIQMLNPMSTKPKLEMILEQVAFAEIHDSVRTFAGDSLSTAKDSHISIQ